MVITPTERTLTAQLHKAQLLWLALGCEVSTMSPQAHDAAFAAVSHLPHLLAFAMMHSITGQLHGEEYLQLAGPGFKDFTRIAAADAKIWHDILLANRTEVLNQLQHYRQALQAFEEALQATDTATLVTMMEHASAARSQCFAAPKKD